MAKKVKTDSPLGLILGRYGIIALFFLFLFVVIVFTTENIIAALLVLAILIVLTKGLFMFKVGN